MTDTMTIQVVGTGGNCTALQIEYRGAYFLMTDPDGPTFDPTRGEWFIGMYEDEEACDYITGDETLRGWTSWVDAVNVLVPDMWADVAYAKNGGI